MKKIIATVFIVGLFASAPLAARPDTIEEYVILEQQAYENFVRNPCLATAKIYLKTVRESYKQTWAEKNEAQYALMQAGVALAGVAATAYLANQANQPAQVQAQGAQPAQQEQPVVQQAPRPQDAPPSYEESEEDDEQPGRRRAMRRVA